MPFELGYLRITTATDKLFHRNNLNSSQCKLIFRKCEMNFQVMSYITLPVQGSARLMIRN